MKQLKTEIKRNINVKWSALHSYPPCVRGVSTGYGLDSRGCIPGRGKMFFSTTSTPVLRPTQPPTSGYRGLITFANYNYFYIMP
jgi:hypothetical protein